MRDAVPDPRLYGGPRLKPKRGPAGAALFRWASGGGATRGAEARIDPGSRCYSALIQIGRSRVWPPLMRAPFDSSGARIGQPARHLSEAELRHPERDPAGIAGGIKRSSYDT